MSHSDDIDDPDKLNHAQIEKLFAYQLMQANNAAREIVVTDDSPRMQSARPRVNKVGAIEIALKAARRDKKTVTTMPPIENLTEKRWASHKLRDLSSAVEQPVRIIKDPLPREKPAASAARAKSSQPGGTNIAARKPYISKSLTLFSMGLPGKPMTTPLSKSTPFHKPSKSDFILSKSCESEMRSPSEPTSDNNCRGVPHTRSPIRLPSIAFKDAGYESCSSSGENDSLDGESSPLVLGFSRGSSNGPRESNEHPPTPNSSPVPCCSNLTQVIH
jgi:hypothetical protein